MIALHRILVPTDFSEHACQAAKYAAAFAEKFGAEIYLLHILQEIWDEVPNLKPLRVGIALSDLASEQTHQYHGRVTSRAHSMSPVGQPTRIWSAAET